MENIKTNLKEVLELFCGKEGWRDRMKRPFYNKASDNIWATDGKALIMVSKELAGTNYPIEDEPLEMPAILSKEQWRTITIEQVRKAFEKCPQEEIIEIKETKCPECGGEEVVLWEYHSRTGNEHWHKREYECPICEGTGFIDKEQPTGRYKESEDALVSIGFGVYKIGLIKRVVKAMELLGTTAFSVITTPCALRMVVFELAENVRVALMPYRKEEEDVVVEIPNE